LDSRDHGKTSYYRECGIRRCFLLRFPIVPITITILILILILSESDIRKSRKSFCHRSKRRERKYSLSLRLCRRRGIQDARDQLLLLSANLLATILENLLQISNLHSLESLCVVRNG
jgi:hypothetical protein